MSQEYSQSRSRGSRRRGRRPGHRREDRSTSPAPSKPAKKPTLWQKVTAFFSGETKQETPAKGPYGSTPKPTRARENRRKEDAPPRPPRQPRKPESVEVTSPRLYVGNLSFDATESDLFDLFSGAGSVTNIEVVSNKHTQRSKGFAFVQMQSIEEALRAVEVLHDKEYMGRKLVVSGAKAMDERRSETNGQQPAAA